MGGRGENAKNFTQHKLSACLLEIIESYFEKQNIPSTNRSWRGVEGSDKHVGPTLPGAGLSGSEGGEGGVPSSWSVLTRPQPVLLQGVVLTALLDILTVSSVPAGHFQHSAHVSLPCFNVTCLHPHLTNS